VIKTFANMAAIPEAALNRTELDNTQDAIA